MKRKRTRFFLINLSLTLMLVLVLLPASSSSKTTQPSRATSDGDCMSQCHMDMSDCLGNGGGYSCIENFYECSAGCNQLLQ